MSFRCEGCGQPQPNGTRARKILRAVESVDYAVYIPAKGYGAHRVLLSNSRGFQAVCGGEVMLCVPCAAKAPKEPERVGHRDDLVRVFLEEDPRYRRDPRSQRDYKPYF